MAQDSDLPGEHMPSDGDIAQEIGGNALSHFVAQSPALPLIEMGDRQFEILAYLILREKAGRGTYYDDVSLLLVGADKGRDVLLRRGAVTGIIQCKRLAREMTRKALITEILRLALYAARDPRLVPVPGTRYEIWTASGLTDDARSFIDSDNPASVMRSEMPKLADRARRGIASLRPYASLDQAQAELARALDIAARLKLAHVGPEAIANDLARMPSIRRQFFRSPDDRPPPASVAEVDQLARRLRDHQLSVLRAASRYKPERYVEREDLAESFEAFLQDPRRVFAVVGGSGQGKTSWSAHLLASPPPGHTTVLIPAEQIASSDGTPVDTVARLLTSRPMGGVNPNEISQAVWSWLDAGNRVLVVDGLDRVRADVTASLPTWLQAAVEMPQMASVRVVLTARQEIWSTLTGQLPGLADILFNQSGGGRSPSSHLMSELTPEAAEAFYSAYGVAPEQHRGARLRSPSLIAVFARLRRGLGGAVSRIDILDAELEAIRLELRAAGVGAIAGDQTLRWLGDRLHVSTDGWIEIPEFSQNAQALEALVDRDRLLRGDGALRFDSDDVAEALLSERLDVGEIVAQLDAERSDPIFIGAAALAVARTEGDGSLDAALDKLLDGAPIGFSARLDVACNAILELRSPKLAMERIRQALGLWGEQQNLMLFAGGLGRLINEVDTPGRARFDLVLPLIDGDEADDWRDKYWRRGTPGRLVTRFATAIERAVEEDPVGLLPEVIGMSEEADHLRSGIGRSLLFRAAAAAPRAALAAAWEARADAPHAFRVAAAAEPVEAARFLQEVELDGPAMDDLVAKRLYEVAHSSEDEAQDDLPNAVRDAADGLLGRVASSAAKAQLLVLRLQAEHSDEPLGELDFNWEHVSDDIYWLALSVLPVSKASQRLIALLEGRDPGRDVLRLLSAASVYSLDTLDPELLALPLLRFADGDAARSRGAAALIEGLLYQRSDPAPQVLEDLASQLARSPHDETRAQLIYYAGSAVGHPATAGEIARQERLLTILIANETGTNLSQLVWKIIESAPERPDPQSRLNGLVRRFGRSAVIEAIGFFSGLPGADGLDLDFSWAQA